MTSEKKTATHQRIGSPHTGPSTPEGKAAVSANAIKHGILSKKMLIKGEVKEEFDDFQASLFSALGPKGPLEELLASKLVVLAWRQRRIIWAEGELFDGRLGSSSNQVPGETLPSWWGDILLNLQRYETSLDRSFYRTLGELERIQSDRRHRDLFRGLSQLELDPLTDAEFVSQFFESATAPRGSGGAVGHDCPPKLGSLDNSRS
jgi:hypothetical protein